MTSGDAKGDVPLSSVVRDIRTQLAAIVVVLQAAGFYVETPTERERLKILQLTQQEAQTTKQEVEDLRDDHTSIRARIDSIAQNAQAVRAIVQVQCLRERDRLARQILRCERFQ